MRQYLVWLEEICKMADLTHMWKLEGMSVYVMGDEVTLCLEVCVCVTEVTPIQIGLFISSELCKKNYVL
jgi:hypothetical protein